MKVLIVCLAALAVVACTSADPEPATVSIPRLLALSDGDYTAGTYADGVLAPPEAGYRDLLSTVQIEDGDVETAHLEISNSVTAAPEVLALSPDGTTAFVAERLGRRQPGDVRSTQLTPGTRLFAVDVAELSTPSQRAVTTIAPAPEALAVRPDGAEVAVVSNTPEASVLELIPWRAGSFGEPRRFDLDALGVPGTSLATNVQWHPAGDVLAINITDRNLVAFFRLDDGGLRPWGAPVQTGVDPYVGRFTPDGRHYVTANWGRDLETTNPAERLPKRASTVGVIELGDVHRVVDTADTDKSSEGLAISPDGRLIATVNMRGTVVPPGGPGYDEAASVSLLELDDGQLTKIGDYPLAGVLPEGGTFDATGRFFLASVFQGRAGSPDGPGVQVYRVGPPEAPGLTPVQRIPLPHGVHHVVAGA